MKQIYAIVLAGGSGQRMGTEGNKVFLPLRGIPAIVRAIVPFSALCKGIVVVAREEDQTLMRETLVRFQIASLVTKIVTGGADRQASVANGLAALPEDAEAVLVHDGARALITAEVIRNVIESIRAHGSGVASIPVTDTIKSADSGGFVLETLPRETLFAIQTPQGFRVSLLRQAHEHANLSGYRATDDAALLEAAGLPVHLCMGDRENIKLTTPMDRILADLILQNRDEREGQ